MHINTRANTYTPAGVCVYNVVRKIYFSMYNRYTKKSSVNCCRSGGDNAAASRIRGRPPRTSGRRLSPRPSVELTAYVATALIPSHFFTCLNSLLITVHCLHFAHFICDIRYIFFVCFQSLYLLYHTEYFLYYRCYTMRRQIEIARWNISENDLLMDSNLISYDGGRKGEDNV